VPITEHGIAIRLLADEAHGGAANRAELSAA